MWRLGDGTQVRAALRAHDRPVNAVAWMLFAGGSLVMVSGGGEGRLRVWRLADGTPTVPPLDLTDG